MSDARKRQSDEEQGADAGREYGQGRRHATPGKNRQAVVAIAALLSLA
jgi:hypothetical protein